MQQDKYTSLISQMTLEEKLGLLYGDGGMCNHPVERLGISAFRMNDATRAVRLETGVKTTCLPCGTSLASTFSKEAAELYGSVIGEECLATGTDAILGPGMNLMRSPLCGRNFEYMGEDPVLTGKLAAAYVRGCQKHGVAACPKHFALNQSESARMMTSANVDERTLRELYLRSFEIVTKEGHPWLFMCSYNKINGIHASENRHLQVEILKGEWGYEGVIVSDWGAVHSAYQAIMNGMDLEMAGGDGAWFNRPLRQLVQNGLVPMEVIDEHVLRLLKLMDKFGCLDPEQRKARARGSLNTKEHQLAAKRLAQEGSVLLKNNGILPLDPARCKKIVVCGPSADFQHNMGNHRSCGGSGAGHPPYEITPLAGIQAMLPKDTELLYMPLEIFRQNSILPGRFLRTPDGQPGLQGDFYHFHPETMEPEPSPFHTRTETDFSIHIGKVSANIATEVGSESPLDSVRFFARWHGFFVAEKTGPVSLSVSRSGWSSFRLLVNGQTVLDSNAVNYRDLLSEYRFEAVQGIPVPVCLEYYRKADPATTPVELKLHYEEPVENDLSAIRDADAILYFGGSNHVYDREAVGISQISTYADIPDLDLPGHQNDWIRKLCTLNPNVIVTLIHGSVLNTEPWVDQVAALLSVWYPGMEAGNAIAEMLFGKAAPAGRLCCTWAKDLKQYPCHAYGLFPGNLEQFHPFSDYLEKEAVGYRHFDSAGIPVRFPFGFGLSYTTFDYRLLSMETEGRQVTAKVRVTNTGTREGAAVVQLYLHDTAPAQPVPSHELADFAKTHLQPGETADITLHAEERDFCRFDESSGTFRFHPSTYQLQFALSSQKILFEKEVSLH